MQVFNNIYKSINIIVLSNIWLLIERKFCVILGSGESINQLTSQELDLINSQPVRIGLNKFSAYFRKAQISPTHVYFTDIFSEASRNYLNLIFKRLTAHNLKPTYILNKKVRYRATKSRFMYQILTLIYAFPNLFFNHFKTILHLPNTGKFEFIGYQTWNNPNNTWSSTLSQDLYHFKGSLSTVFNYCAINFPQLDILLVGVDFNGSKYFFQEELDQEEFVTSDRTTSITRSENKHFSLIPTEGGLTLMDRIPYILDKLSDQNITVYSVNGTSRFVKEGFIDVYNPNS
jgi:hypothetical protein